MKRRLLNRGDWSRLTWWEWVKFVGGLIVIAALLVWVLHSLLTGQLYG